MSEEQAGGIVKQFSHRTPTEKPKRPTTNSLEEILSVQRDIMKIIEETNRRVADDLKKLQWFEKLDVLPTPGAEYEGIPTVYATGASLPDVRLCMLTGTSPDVYAWEKLRFCGYAFASIFTYENSSAQTIATGDTYVKVTAFNTNGQSRNATPDHTNDQITIVKSGVYRVQFNQSFSCDTNNVNFKTSIHIDGAEEDSIHVRRKLGTANDIGSASASGIIFLNAGQVIDVRTKHDSGGDVDITVEYSNLNISLI